MGRRAAPVWPRRRCGGDKGDRVVLQPAPHGGQQGRPGAQHRRQVAVLDVHDAVPCQRRARSGACPLRDRGTTTSAAARATRPYAVMLWWLTPRCRGRRSASDIRRTATGLAPTAAAALTASPAATPEKPQVVPVPRLPGPWVTTTASAPSTRTAASRPACTVTASRSPPKACPTVTVPTSRSATPRHACREPQRQGAAVGHHVRDPRAGGAPEEPASTAGSEECRSATTTGAPGGRQRFPGGEQRVRGRVLLVGPVDDRLQGGVARLTRCPGRSVSGGSRSGRATTNA